VGRRAGAFRAHSLIVLTLGPEGIAGLTAFLDARLPPRFGLPDALPEGRGYAGAR
jgi:hypothetical protein